MRDLRSAIDRWLALGVGPWFVLPEAAQAMSHRGREVAPRISVAFANSGDLQIELIEQFDDTPSVYREFLDRGQEGLHHRAWWTDDFESTTERVRRDGWETVTSSDGGGFARYCYLERPDLPGVLVEIMELTAVTRGFMDAIRDAAVDWDGTEPVR